MTRSSSTPLRIEQGGTGAYNAEDARRNLGILNLTGPQGPQGNPGATGAQGAAGNNGAAGAQGIQGIQGIQGAEGPQGDDGPEGPPGSGEIVWTYTAAGADAAPAMAVNTFYYADISGYTADRTATLPGTAAVGDRIAIKLTVGDTAFELLITATAGDTLDGVAGGTEWSRLFIAKEMVIFRCVVANTTWVIEHDGRIAQRCVMRLSTTTANETAATWTSPTAISGVWTADGDNASLAATANDRISVRRTGNYNLMAEGYSDAGPADQQYFGVVLWKNGVATLIGTRLATSPKAGANQSPNWAIDVAPLTAGDTVNYQFISEAGSLKLRGGAAGTYKSWFSVLEVL